MKLFTTSQIAAIDQYTIDHEPIADIDLMERAAKALTYRLLQCFPEKRNIAIFAGRGNNGGDALAMARMLAEADYPTELFLLPGDKPLTGPAAINQQRLADQNRVEIHLEEQLPLLLPNTLIIDGLFGSGLSRPLTGIAAAWVNHLNQSGCEIVSIDMPSGLMGEENGPISAQAIIKATLTLTLQFPKIALLLAENHSCAGKVEVIDIGLHPAAMEKTPTEFNLTESSLVATLLPKRSKFDHKGTFGHAMLLVGSKGKMGAAVLAAKGCLRSGAGLVTAHIPGSGYTIMQTALPEAMCSCDHHPEAITDLPDLTPYNAIAAGPGIGTGKETTNLIMRLIEAAQAPLVLDADALNILASNPGSLEKLPANTILTPHPGEFRRLFGEVGGDWQRLELARLKAVEYGIIIVLKGAHTAIILPTGAVHFNTTGNPGMASGGSGDVLTGIIAGLLAQGVSPVNAAISGVFLHGLAGDIGSETIGEAALLASDIIDHLGIAFLKLNGSG